MRRLARRVFAICAPLLLLPLRLAAAAAADAPPAPPLPERPIATLRGHGGRGVAFSGDGARLVTFGARNARPWDVATGRPVGPPAKHDAEIVAAAPDATGARLLTAAGRSADLSDAATGEVLQKWAHDAEVHSASFDGAGRRVLIAGGGEVRVWDAGTGERLWMAQHAHRLHSAEFAAAGDTRVLAVVYRSREDLERAEPDARHRFIACVGTALLWDAGTGVLLRRFEPTWSPSSSPRMRCSGPSH